MKLAGNIADISSSTGPVKNATLTATHKETGTTYVVKSNEKGEFQFDSLEPGKYTLKVSHQEYSEMAGIDFWVNRENLTRLPTIPMFRKNEHSVILCQ
jgi:protocatechuate 3,4-dioxygenase beta subunit